MTITAETEIVIGTEIESEADIEVEEEGFEEDMTIEGTENEAADIEVVEVEEEEATPLEDDEKNPKDDK